MKIAITRDVKKPTRGKDDSKHERAGGIDFFVPHQSEKFDNDLLELNGQKIEHDFSFSVSSAGYTKHFIKVKPHQNILIPSGIHINMLTVKGFNFDEHNGLILEAANKSSISRFKHLDVGATIIDEDYQGEVHISLTNTSSEPVAIYYGEKIAQFIIKPIIIDDTEVVDIDDLYKETGDSSRGANGFGSTTQQNTFKMIFATDANYGLGFENELLFKSKEEMQVFKKLTTEKTCQMQTNWVVMGRKTYESIGKPLPNRVNIVISRSAKSELNYLPEDVLVMTFEQFKEFSENVNGYNTFWFLGGAEIYREAFDKFKISEIYCSKFNQGALMCDTYLPLTLIDVVTEPRKNGYDEVEIVSNDEFSTVRLHLIGG